MHMHIEKFMIWLCRIMIGSVGDFWNVVSLRRYGNFRNYVILQNAWDQTSQVLNHKNKIV